MLIYYQPKNKNKSIFLVSFLLNCRCIYDIVSISFLWGHKKYNYQHSLKQMSGFDIPSEFVISQKQQISDYTRTIFGQFIFLISVE